MSCSELISKGIVEVWGEELVEHLASVMYGAKLWHAATLP